MADAKPLKREYYYYYDTKNRGFPMARNMVKEVEDSSLKYFLV